MNVKLLFYLSLLLMPFAMVGQEPLQVDAGRDTNFCGSSELQNEFAPFHLNASVEGGTPPYEFEWTMLNPVFFDGQYWDEHYFLDSTSVSNPLVKTNVILSNNVYHDAPVLKFALIATDGIGSSVSDSVKVSSSYFTWSLLNLFKIIHQGDSATLFEPNIWGGIPPLKYHWEPSGSMSNSDSITPTVPTLETTNYNVTITDVEGCTEVEFGSHNTIYVMPTGIADVVNKGSMKVRNDGIGYTLEREATSGNCRVSVTDMVGRMALDLIWPSGEKQLTIRNTDLLPARGVISVYSDVGELIWSHKYHNPYW